MMRSLLACLASLLLAPVAIAHKASTTYTHLQVTGSRVEGRMEVALRDLDVAVGLDSNGDGDIRWREVKAASGKITSYLQSRFSIVQDKAACPLSVAGMRLVEHSDGHYAVLGLTALCPKSVERLSLEYRLLFDVDALHRGLAAITYAPHEEVVNVLFSPTAQRLDVEPGKSQLWRVLKEYFVAGLLHVWSGLDHLLFLAGLFLPAVLRRVDGRWLPVRNLRTALRDSAFIVTAFTAAHACTLTLAATGAFTLPSRLVESAVALTVLFAGLNNLVPMVYRELFWLSGVFGLIHGAAVASALIDMGLPSGSRVSALLAFNLGVEAAQLSLLALVILPAFAARRSTLYRAGILVPGSALVSVVGACWFIERTFNVYFGVPLP